MTSVADALGATLTGERAGVAEDAPADGGTTDALLPALAAAVAGGATPALPAASDRLAALTAVRARHPVPAAAHRRRDVTTAAAAAATAAAAAVAVAAAASPAGGGGGRPARRPPPR